MLKITATGNLTNDVELKTQEDGRPYAILRIASDRRYRAKDGSQLTDFVSVKVRGRLAERCAAFAWKGCKLAAAGDFETIETDPGCQPGFLIQGTDVEFLSPRRAQTAAQAAKANQEAATRLTTQRSGCESERRSSGVSELPASAGSEGYEACSDESA